MENTNGVQPNAQLSRIDSLKNILNAPSVQEQFKNALAENSGPFVAGVIDLFNGDTSLQKCNPKEVVMEALKAAVLKLPINKSLGFAYIVPFGTKPTFQIGYKGLIQLAMRTGQYRHINADLVFEGEFVSRNKLTGEFDLNGQKTSDKVVGYFAYIELLNGFSKTLYMTKEKVIEHGKKYSKAFNNGPWKTDFDAMAIKTVLRNLLGHYGYLSVDMITAIDNDGETDVADRVQDEIQNKGNRTDMSFQDAEIIDDQVSGDYSDSSAPVNGTQTRAPF